MSYVDYAEKELELSFGSKDKWSKSMTKDVLELLEVFSKQGHSGMSAPVAVGLFAKLALFKPLVPLTGDPDEWDEVGLDPEGEETTFQNRRLSSVFKVGKDGRAYNIDAIVFEDPEGIRYTNRDSRKFIDFPYMPPDKPEIVKVDKDHRPLT